MEILVPNLVITQASIYLAPTAMWGGRGWALNLQIRQPSNDLLLSASKQATINVANKTQTQTHVKASHYSHPAGHADLLRLR